jgi:hypothetical protein
VRGGKHRTQWEGCEIKRGRRIMTLRDALNLRNLIVKNEKEGTYNRNLSRNFSRQINNFIENEKRHMNYNFSGAIGDGKSLTDAVLSIEIPTPITYEELSKINDMRKRELFKISHQIKKIIYMPYMG